MGRRRILTIIQRVVTANVDGSTTVWKSKAVRLKEGDKFKTYWPAKYEKDGNMFEVISIWHGISSVLYTRWLRTPTDLTKRSK